jgi:menaquinone-dependent protoporphyrinogen oxidase
MGSVLVVYGSWSGATAGVAQRLARAMTLQGARVMVVPASSAPNPAAYDAVVVGSAIHSGEWHPRARSWVTHHAAVLKEKPVACFSVCLTPVAHAERTPEARGYSLPVSAEAGILPMDAAVFAGAYEPGKHSWIERLRAKTWGAKPGDFRDWVAIDRWANGLVREFGV